MTRAAAKAFGPIECVMSIGLIALATYGVASTMIRQAGAVALPWMQSAGSVWV